MKDQMINAVEVYGKRYAQSVTPPGTEVVELVELKKDFEEFTLTNTWEVLEAVHGGYTPSEIARAYIETRSGSESWPNDGFRSLNFLSVQAEVKLTQAALGQGTLKVIDLNDEGTQVEVY